MLKKFITTINRSIFVGERFERNIHNLLTESYIFIALGVSMFTKSGLGTSAISVIPFASAIVKADTALHTMS